jgi:dephospho-CoA kinase
MKIFGLTGGIACGKSTVSQHWAQQGLPIVDADLVSRKCVDRNTKRGFDSLMKIREAFGPEVFGEDGRASGPGYLDRKALGRIVFADPEKKILEGILEPSYKSILREEMMQHEDAGCEWVCYDNAMLVEQSDWSLYRPVVVVHVPLNIQMQRLLERTPSLTSAEAMARVLSQMPGSRRLKFADYVIDNSGSVEETLLTADVVLREIRSRWA